VMAPLFSSEIGERGYVLVVGNFAPWISRHIDPKCKVKLNKEGFKIGTCEYSEINEEILKKFNVVILTWFPSEGDTKGREIFERKIPLFLNYVQEGGGIAIWHQEAYNSYKVTNELLQHLDAEILPESVADEKNYFRQKNYLHHFFAFTRNIEASPLADGVKELIYPLGYKQAGGATLTFKVSQSWNVVIKGEKEARSYSFLPHQEGKGTYESAPPLLAIREYGKGRIVLFPSHPTYWIHAGYHRIWEGICLDKGDGWRLVTNILDWLSEPSKGKFGGFSEVAPPPPQPPTGVASTDPYQALIMAGGRKFITELTHKKRPVKDFTGIIGVYTNYSKGRGSVEEFCHTAKEEGYSFIVFTEDFEMMDEEKWKRLVEDCKKCTSESFIAIPGIEIKNTAGDTFISFDLPRWPEKEWLDVTGKKLENHPGFYFGLDWPPTYLMLPKTAFVPPYMEKFYSGLEVFSYSHGGNFISQCLDDYLYCQYNDYNLIPIVSHRLFSPAEVREVRGFKVHALAESVKDIPSCFKYYWYAPRWVYISEGPLIREFQIENGRAAYRDEEWRLFIEVESDADIKKVTLLDKGKVFRQFFPKGKKFYAEVGGYHDKQRYFVLLVEDTKGRRAISSALYTSDVLFSTYMCTDLQNTLNSMSFVNDEGKIDFCTVMGNYVTCWDGSKMGILVAGKDLMPEGLDYVVGGWDFACGPVIYAKSKTEGGVASREITFGSGECQVMDNHFNTTLLPGSFPAPIELYNADVRFTSFRPQPYGYNVMLIESVIIFKKDVQLTLREDGGPEILGLNIWWPEETLPQYSYINSQGKKVKGQRNGESFVLQGEIFKGGYIALYPDFYGSVAVFPLSEANSFYIKGNSLQIGWKMPGRVLRRGDTLKGRWLLVRGKFGEEEETGFEALRRVFGLERPYPYDISVRVGKIVSPIYPLALEAKDYLVAFSLSSPQPLPIPLAMEIWGINENWDAGLIIKGEKELRRIGVFQGKAFVRFEDTNGKEVLIGNLLYSDKEELKLSLFKRKSGWLVEVHNPTDRKLTAVVKTQEWLKGIVPYFSKKITLMPGETKSFKLGGI